MALLTTANELLTADIHHLQSYITTSERGLPPASRRPPHHFPAPRSGTITSLALGQNHWHTLHSDGTVASLGQDPSGRGYLGLGGPTTIAPFRGVQAATGSPYVSGPAHRLWGDAKTVWFDALQHRWVTDLVNRSRSHKSSAGANARAMMIQDGHVHARAAMGDWFELEGRKWQDGVAAATTTEDGSGDLGAYFAVKVAVGGLHSAALVLVDDEAVERVRQRHMMIRTDEHGKGKGIVGSSAHRITHGMLSLGARVLGLKGREDRTRHRHYDWQKRGDVLPRLRMESGQLMPGHEDVAN